MIAGFHVPRCECGHVLGDHQSARTTFPHLPRFGLCLVKDCPCRGFKEAKT